MKFTCKIKGCGATQECSSFDDIVRSDKMCDNCLYEQKKERARESLDKNKVVFKCPICEEDYLSLVNSNYDKGKPLKLTCSDKCKKEKASRAKKASYSTYCLDCGIRFKRDGNATYCSDECRTKGTAKKRFRKNLDLANKAISLSKVRVFGANTEKGKKYVNEKSRKTID
jgi:hypothetical protein